MTSIQLTGNALCGHLFQIRGLSEIVTMQTIFWVPLCGGWRNAAPTDLLTEMWLASGVDCLILDAIDMGMEQEILFSPHKAVIVQLFGSVWKIRS